MTKRVFDIIFSLLLLIFIAIPCIVISFLIFINLGCPIFFIQKRIGFGESPFNLIKFRSMSYLASEDSSTLSDESRLSKFGLFLRSTSLDELPELINVLRGEMSLVGPRPLLVEYLPLYNPRQALRHSVLPGITGWAQVNGRNQLSWEDKFELDVWYVGNRTMALDVKILILTIKKVLLREGISTDGEVTATKFTGSNS
jgi:lipopolysaccharide/colanic/teichoic acid biosynthesis glycosyltransferase